MSWKLMNRDERSRDVIEPIVSLGMGGSGHIPTNNRIWAAARAYRAAHDAAPSEPTDAVKDVVRAYIEIMGEEHERVVRLRTACPGLVEDAMEGEK